MLAKVYAWVLNHGTTEFPIPLRIPLYFQTKIDGIGYPNRKRVIMSSLYMTIYSFKLYDYVLKNEYRLCMNMYGNLLSYMHDLCMITSGTFVIILYIIDGLGEDFANDVLNDTQALNDDKFPGL